MKFSAFYGSQRLITMSTGPYPEAHELSRLFQRIHPSLRHCITFCNKLFFYGQEEEEEEEEEEEG
jgi:hypothetical protein